MKKEELISFKKQLLNLKTMILNKNNSEERHISNDELADEVDLATATTSQQISLSLQERDLNKLKKIERALDKMEIGQYGQCEDCGEPIELKRLQRQPWSVLCLEHAEELERKSSHFMYKKA